MTDEKNEKLRPGRARGSRTTARGGVAGVVLADAEVSALREAGAEVSALREAGAVGPGGTRRGMSRSAAGASASAGGEGESGVVPVLFSASAEAHDVAVVAPDRGADWRSPFDAPLRPASGE
ncbi:hypothetical protein [Amycolatopsis jiangsuensis]|uniref:Uncharacterized protein n=1 Tax=Amycolatopsis jiangsuensis TaxID=1181879 RepID=A0A840IXZ3_9PSEU|nr:hypothetical protein [Amycolatopsis jiangsuensis]MBB4686720.1 hypothetical protein [Amycolatopsis jiangsuensis]